MIDAERLARNWKAITIELDAPRPSRTERLLRWLRVPPHVTRLVVATPALRRSWFIAVGLMVFIGLTAADDADPRASAFLLLLLAPIAPVLGVALAYGTPGDPGHEVHLATPMSGLRLLLTRTAVVLAVVVPLVTLPALLSPVTRPWAVAWVLPALAVTSFALALMTVTSPNRSAGLAAVAWIVAAVVARNSAHDELAAFLPAAQLVAVVLALGCGLVTVLRRDRFERLAIG
jgi:hypothetical protein